MGGVAAFPSRGVSPLETPSPHAAYQVLAFGCKYALQRVDQGNTYADKYPQGIASCSQREQQVSLFKFPLRLSFFFGTHFFIHSLSPLSFFLSFKARPPIDGCETRTDDESVR